MNAPSVAVIVPRVSTGKQVEGTSLDAQEAACLRAAERENARVHAIYRDEGISGKLYHARTGLQQALADIEEGRANLLVTLKLDRAGRDVDTLRAIKRRVEAAGGRLVFADGMNFQKNAVGNLMFTQLAGFAEFEVELIRERTVNGKQNRARDGVQPARNWSPYGYHIVTRADMPHVYPKDLLGTYQVVEDQARWVREIFARFASGQSMYRIAEWLQASGVPTPRGGKAWS